MTGPGFADQLRTLPLRWRAGRRRTRGWYDKHTLRLFRRSRGSDAASLLGYLLFRRDLGHPLHPRFVTPLLTRFKELAPRQQWQAAALLTEIGAAPGWVWQHVQQGAGIATAAPNQEVWREGFAAALVAARDTGIVVVGNGAHLLGRRLGPRIDAAGIVIRFNQWCGARDTSDDIGRRISTWVTSPGYQKPRSDDAEWVIVSGPDMCFRLRNWEHLAVRMRRARPVVTVPLGPWRELVAVLGAPPSAGVLTLAWLRMLLGGWQGISIAGIGDGTTERYHHAHPRLRGSSRHDWPAESALIQRWCAEGLTLLTGPERATEVPA